MVMPLDGMGALPEFSTPLHCYSGQVYGIAKGSCWQQALAHDFLPVRVEYLI
jgi:hypothetical protein